MDPPATAAPPATDLDPSPTPSPWSPTGPSASLVQDTGLVTLVEGSSFCISGRSGDVAPGRAQGLFVLDTRVLSRWELTVDGRGLEPLTVAADTPFDATFVGRVHPTPHESDSELLVVRRRHVGDGLREQIRVKNFSPRTRSVVVGARVDADFADVFEVKESRVRRRAPRRVTATSTELVVEQDGGAAPTCVRLSFPPATTVEPGELTWHLDVPAQDEAELCIEVALVVDGTEVEPRFRCGAPDERADPVRRHSAWRAGAPVLTSDSGALDRSVGHAIGDLGALRFFDRDHPDVPVVAAGAPWFMTLFGRDSLLTSWMALLVDPSLAQGVLETLARLQGTEVDGTTEEEPGRILHEVRFGSRPSLALGGRSIYFGTADATPLFVVVAGELSRWGLGDDVAERLLPHVDRALEWIERHGDRDGDGYVEYERRNPSGLVNQGWKDSWDGISFADGRLPRAPIALCEVQGYVYAAYRARAHLARTAGDTATEERYRERARALREAFNRDFWIEERGWFALGLDADKQPIDALASNVGHCLWTGIVDDERAPLVADRLLSSELFSGWGVRTLASTMGRYNPISYHNGSVWPHDSAICAAGLMRYGFVDHAHRVIGGLLDVADALGGRLPELFAGLSRAELPVPAAYPTSCSPQAWSAASPLLALRALLRFDPDAGRGRVVVAPALPSGLRELHLRGVEVAGRTLDIRVVGDDVAVEGLDGLELLREAPAATGDDRWGDR